MITLTLLVIDLRLDKAFWDETLLYNVFILNVLLWHQVPSLIKLIGDVGQLLFKVQIILLLSLLHLDILADFGVVIVEGFRFDYLLDVLEFTQVAVFHKTTRR